MSSSHAPLTPERLAKRPLKQFHLVVENFIAHAKQLESRHLFKDAIDRALELLETQKNALGPHIAPFEQKREPMKGGDKVEALDKLETEIKTASQTVNQLPLELETKKTAFATKLQQLENDRSAALDKEALKAAGEMKDKSTEYLRLDSESKRLGAEITAVQTKIDEKWCGCFGSCFPSCNKAELDQKATLEAQLATATASSAKLTEEIKAPAKPPTNETITGLEALLLSTRKEAEALPAAVEEQLKIAKQALEQLELQRTELNDKLKNEGRFYSAWITNEIMLECLRVYVRFMQFSNTIHESIGNNPADTHLQKLQSLCLEYQNSVDGLLGDGRLWCPNSEDNDGLQIYEMFNKLDPGSQKKLFEKPVPKEILDQFLPEVAGYKLINLQKHLLRVRMNFFKPDRSHLGLAPDDRKAAVFRGMIN